MWAIQSKNSGKWVYRKPEMDEVHWGVSRREAMTFPTESRAELFIKVNHIDEKRYEVVEVRMEVVNERSDRQTDGD